MTGIPEDIRRVRLILRAIVIVVGLLEAWALRYHIFSDGIQYLEIARKYSQGDWKSAVNAYWSPLYSWVLALGFAIAKPAPYFHVALLHLTNLLAYLAGLLAFEYFLNQLLRFQGESSGASDAPTLRSQKSFLVIAYLLFVFGGVHLIRVAYPSPDMIVAFFVYLLQGMLIAIVRKRDRTWPFFAAFGAILGLAFLTKAAFSGLVPIYLLLAGVRLRPPRLPAQRRIAIAVTAFLVVVAPFLIALYQQKGYWTIGEAGKLNYAWEVRGVTRSTHWQGEPVTFGTPQHPTRRIFTSPDAFEFAEPLHAAAYAPWFDPSYWYAGLRPGFSAVDQWRAFRKYFAYAMALFLVMPGIAGYLILAGVQAARGQPLPRPDLGRLALAAPAVAGILLYSLVFVEKRYIAAFLVVLCATLFAELHLRHGLDRGLARYLPHTAVATAIYALTPLIFYGFFLMLQEAVNRHEVTPNANALIAGEMSALGIRPGDKIAYIGLAIDADWVRLLEARVIAEITVKYEKNTDLSSTLRLNPVEVEKFWKLDAAGQEHILREFARLGARAVVADILPAWASPQGWQKLRTRQTRQVGGEDVYVRMLAP